MVYVNRNVHAQSIHKRGQVREQKMIEAANGNIGYN